MVYEFFGPSGKVITTDDAVAHELIETCTQAGYEFDQFDPADNGTDQIYLTDETRSEYEEKEQARRNIESNIRTGEGLYL